ncbi:MAG TPA: hypothetical protein VKA27_10095 [Sunxiuqinia sp.]|nr:hypothetical protein [Sunxiuqinia sp.]
MFVFTAIALRFFSFFSSVLDHDESTYLIIGRDLLHGKSLYADVTDSKPVGIFLIYAFMQFVFGYSILLKRIVVAALVGITAHIVNKVSIRFFQNKKVGIASGLMYIYLSSTWNYFGISPNAELFFNFFTIGALFVLFQKGPANYFFAGLLFGLGFIIKYMVLFDFLAITSFFLVKELIDKKRRFSFSELLPYLLSGIGFAIPFGLVNLYFYLGNHFDAFYFITYELPGRYRSHTTLWQFIKLLLDFTGRFFPVTYLMFYVLFSKRSLLDGWPKYFMIYWLVAVLVAVYLPGKGFSHYAIQLMLPVSLIAGVAFDRQFHFDRYTKFVYRGTSGLILLILFVSTIQISAISRKLRKSDQPRIVARYLQTNMNHDDQLYVVNYEHILYYLLKKECPTKYVHESILSTPDLANAFDVDSEKEIDRILQKHPKFIVIKNKFKSVQQKIANTYSLDKSFFNDRVLVYKRDQ